MSFIAQGHGKVPHEWIKIKASINNKIGYSNTQKEAWKVFYFYSKLTPQMAIGSFPSKHLS